MLPMSLVGLISACSLFAEAPPVELASVAEATAHADARHLSFTGQSHPDLLGAQVFGSRSNNGGTKGKVQWLVPVTEPGAEVSGPVALWVTQSFTASDETSPDAWLADLSAGFDGKPVTVRVLGHVKDGKGASWEKAAAKAAAAHGLTLDPKAPVVSWPPK